MSKPPAKWQVVGDKLHADCRIFKVYERRFSHMQDAREGDFYVLNCPNWAQVLAVTTEKKLIMVKQFRFGINSVSLELPGGLIDANEIPEKAAARELLEETGYTGENVRQIGSSNPNPAIMDNQAFYVLIENCVQTSNTQWDEHEEMEILEMSIDEVKNAILKKEITCMNAISAFFHLQEYIQQHA